MRELVRSGLVGLGREEQVVRALAGDDSRGNGSEDLGRDGRLQEKNRHSVRSSRHQKMKAIHTDLKVGGVVLADQLLDLRRGEHPADVAVG